MIIMYDTKVSVDGVDVYPDHEDKTMFWMVPGNVHLADTEDGDKALSYLWYFNGDQNDTAGTGFLNFEVNTAVSSSVQNRIKTALVNAFPDLKSNEIKLAPVTFTKGSVNFSVLGPMATEAGKEAGGAVVYQGNEQVVWHSGSSSLVGDNNAVCSVKFTPEGKMGAAMYAAIKGSENANPANVIAAVYNLEFAALRPSVTFKVTGEFKKTIDDFQASIGAGIPLEAFMLDLGLTGQFLKVMQDTDLKIEVTKYGVDGQDDGKGLEWAQSIVMDYLLKNFFQVDIGDGSDSWSPLKDAPVAETAVKKSAAVSKASEDKSKKEGETDPEKVKEKAQEAVKASLPELPIPKVNIRAKYTHGEQTNKINFMYTETSAQSFPIAPQGLVLTGLGKNRSKYITTVNRNSIPFGLKRPAPVSAPTVETAKDYGLRSINITARYPSGGASDEQQLQTVIYTDGALTSGTNPVPFQYNTAGDSEVAYDAEYVFDPSSDWKAKQTEYKVSGTTDSGINVMPGAVLGFVKLSVVADGGFIWEGVDQALVTISGDDLDVPVTVPLQPGQLEPQELKIRASSRYPKMSYSVRMMSRGNEVASYGPKEVVPPMITVYDQYPTHLEIEIINDLDETKSVNLTVKYTAPDDSYVWESPRIRVKKDAGDPTPVVLPLPQPPNKVNKSDVKISYTVSSRDGEETFETTADKAIWVEDLEN